MMTMRMYLLLVAGALKKEFEIRVFCFFLISIFIIETWSWLNSVLYYCIIATMVRERKWHHRLSKLFKELGSYSLDAMVVMVKCSNCGNEFRSRMVQTGDEETMRSSNFTSLNENCPRCNIRLTYSSQDLLWKEGWSAPV